MSRWPRFRRFAVLKWTGASLCALIFAAWLCSRWFSLGIGLERSGVIQHISIVHGCLWLDRTAGVHLSVTPGWSASAAAIHPTAVGWYWRFHWFSLASSIPATVTSLDRIMVPLYWPFGLLALPTAWFFYRDRQSVRRALAGGCLKCGYDLSGLAPDAACPECGRNRHSPGVMKA